MKHYFRQKCMRTCDGAGAAQHSSPGEVEEVNVPRVEEGLRDVADVFHEIHLKRNKTYHTRFFFLL